MNHVSTVTNIAAVLVIPAVLFSFWRFTNRPEFHALRESGQKLNLNMHNLRSAFKRDLDDPLRPSHVRLAKIGFWHWAAIPLGFLIVLLAGAMAITFVGE